MKSDDDDAWERARLLIAEENYADAFPIVSELYSKYPNDISLKRNMGFLTYELGDFKFFLKFGEELRAMFPLSELDSVRLFHALIKLEKVDSAFNEMERLLHLGESPEYMRLLAEITEEFAGRNDDFAKSIRRHIARIQVLEETMSKTGKRSELTHKIGSIQ